MLIILYTLYKLIQISYNSLVVGGFSSSPKLPHSTAEYNSWIKPQYFILSRSIRAIYCSLLHPPQTIQFLDAYMCTYEFSEENEEMTCSSFHQLIPLWLVHSRQGNGHCPIYFHITSTQVENQIDKVEDGSQGRTHEARVLIGIFHFER